MISGFNTDIEFDGVVYHVQTEDKGVNARMIMTLVYNGGTILASKRSPYDDLITDDFDETLVSDRLGRQHKLICAAVRAGRMDDLKKMSKKAAPATAGVSVESQIAAPETTIPPLLPEIPELPEIADGMPINVTETPIAVAETNVTESDIISSPMTIGSVETQRIISITSPKDFEIVPLTEPKEIEPAQIDIPSPSPAAEEAPTSKPLFDMASEYVYSEISVVEEEFILDADAVEVVSELSGIERPMNEKLSIELLGETKFKGGDRTTVNIMVCRGTARKVVSGSQIMIKVLGSSFRPVIFHAKTDVNGLANVHLQLPHFRAGRAALLIRAMAEGEEVELRRVVTPG